MRTMHSTIFSLTVFFRLAVFLSVVHLTSATPSPSQPSPRGLDFRYPLLRQRDSIVLPDGWSYQGCYMDSSSRPPLTSAVRLSSADMTIGVCVTYCNSHKQIYASLEGGDFCQCGNVLTVGSTMAPLADCTGALASNCVGDPTHKCGASDRLAIYRSGAPDQPLPTIVSTVGSWSSLGCVRDSYDRRILPFPGHVNELDLTVVVCVNACNTLGYNMAGVEWARECWCASGTLQGRGGQVIDSNNCMLACPADSTEICGGDSALVVYQRK